MRSPVQFINITLRRMRSFFSTTCKTKWRWSLALALFWCVGTSNADASCGDYLHVKGLPVNEGVTDSDLSEMSHHRPKTPAPCLTGECRSRDQLPEAPATTMDTRIHEQIRLFHGVQELLNNAPASNSKSSQRPGDDRLPASPHIDSLDKPPQTTFV
jgi:hypothetical protein